MMERAGEYHVKHHPGNEVNPAQAKHPSTGKGAIDWVSYTQSESRGRLVPRQLTNEPYAHTHTHTHPRSKTPGRTREVARSRRMGQQGRAAGRETSCRTVQRQLQVRQ